MLIYIQSQLCFFYETLCDLPQETLSKGRPVELSSIRLQKYQVGFLVLPHDSITDYLRLYLVCTWLYIFTIRSERSARI